jgi:hypothetical protein
VGWRPKGLLLPAPPPVPWAVTHAAVPHAHRSDRGLRLYFSSRDERGRSQIGCAELDIRGLGASVQVRCNPLLRPGALGAFDDSGVTTSCLVRDGAVEYLYYTGWSLGRTVPFYFDVGCAASRDGEHFERISNAPILPRNDIDPFLTASPWVLVEGNRWRMWYVSATGWDLVDDVPRHRYHIKYAESSDGVSWERDGIVCIDFCDASEYALSRPCVVKDGDRYRMWFSARGDTYRIVCASSADGINWTRDVEPVIRSSGDWDSEMQAYPSVFDHDNVRYLLYNGNDYGRTGIGWASWVGSR